MGEKLNVADKEFILGTKCLCLEQIGKTINGDAVRSFLLCLDLYHILAEKKLAQLSDKFFFLYDYERMVILESQ